VRERQRRQPSLEEQLAVLDSCGIRLHAGLTIDHLLRVFDRQEYETEPFQLLLTVMGGEAGEMIDEDSDPLFAYPSDNIWHLDTECIEDHGSYIAVAERMRDLAQGELPLIFIEDYVDINAKAAHLSFHLDGQKYRWEAQVEDDWIDPTILSKFVELLTARNTARQYTYCDLGGQDCLIGCSTPQELASLQVKTWLPFEWLT
jgi:hypothetical protein